jgi:rhodanese-related sulfurtransferase
MINRKLAKAASFRYMILAGILVLLAGGLVLLPKHQKHEGIKPELLLAKSISQERYISTDDLANKLVNQDPSYLLVDVRDSISYLKSTLADAFNIPLKDLLKEDYEGYLNQDSYNVVLFSNDNFYADQAWIICTRLGYKNLHVLKGGINEWFKTIINPPKPIENMPAEAFELYTFRKAASIYFGVGYPEQFKGKITKIKKEVPKKVITVKKKKKAPAEGGC